MATDARAPLRLPPDFWQRADVAAALSAQDLGGVFWLLRQYAGVSQTRIGIAIGMSQGDVSAIMSTGPRRRRVTALDVVVRIADGLDMPADARSALGLARDDTPAAAPARDTAWYPDPELSDRTAFALAAGRPDLRTVRWIERSLSDQRRAEDEFGGVALMPIVRAQLGVVTGMLCDATDATADRLLVIAAEHAHWISWVAFGEGHTGAALRWLDLAHGWAIDAGSPDLISWVARVRSNYTLKTGDAARALRTADLARRVPELSPAAASVACHTGAVAAAAAGERDRSRRLADRALALAGQVPDAADRPPWLYWLDPARAQLNFGYAASAAGDLPTAVGALSEGLNRLDGMPRDRAFFAAKLEDAKRAS